MLDAPPLAKRPTWYAATTVEPKAKLSGSTAVSCWLAGLVDVSTESRRDTTSQFAATRSTASALTMSRPGPQSTRSVPPQATWTRSLPARAVIVSGAGVPTMASPCAVPWIVAATAGAASTSASTARAGRRRRTGGQCTDGSRAVVRSAGVRARRRRARDRQRLRRQRRRAAADGEGLPRRGARGGAAVRLGGLRADELGPAPLSLHAAARPVRHPAPQHARRPGRALRRGRRRRLARLREHAGRAARSVLRRPSVGGGRRLAGGARAVLRASRGGCSAWSRRRSSRPPRRWCARWRERMGVGDTFHRTPVGVYFGEEDGVDPYFGGAGPPRSPCIRCGGCMVGCRHNAKNTLDRNYLWLAERAGAAVHPEREATQLRRVGSGWEVETVRPGPRARRTELFRAEHVVLAAGVLGTLRAALPLRARRPERRRARPLQLGGDRRRGRTRRVRRLLDRHRHRLVVPSECGDAHRAGALPEGLQHDGAVLDHPRRRRRLDAAARPLAARGGARPACVCARAPRAALGRADGDPPRHAGAGQLAAPQLERAPPPLGPRSRRAGAVVDPGGERGGADRRRRHGRPPRIGAERGAARTGRSPRTSSAAP